jgi:hypothetical protein
MPGILGMNIMSGDVGVGFNLVDMRIKALRLVATPCGAKRLPGSIALMRIAFMTVEAIFVRASTVWPSASPFGARLSRSSRSAPRARFALGAWGSCSPRGLGGSRR